MIFKGHKLTIGMDLGDRSSNYCVLDEAGEILLEQKLATTPEAMKQTFERIPRSLIALETGTHSPWVSRLLKELGHAVLVAHAQKVELITKSKRKDDRHDARTLARLARIDPELLGPVRQGRPPGTRCVLGKNQSIDDKGRNRPIFRGCPALDEWILFL